MTGNPSVRRNESRITRDAFVTLTRHLRRVTSPRPSELKNQGVDVQAVPLRRASALVAEQPREYDPELRETVSRMKIFLSWSGEASDELAGILHEWLPTVLQFVDPWMSSEDIAKGARWNPEIGKTLEETSYCIVCVTPGVQSEPWVNFEAGAVAKAVSQSYVSPLLLDVSVEELGGLPLSMFQCTRFNKADILKLLRSINSAAESPVSSRRLKTSLEYSWPGLRERVDGINLSGIEDGGHGTQEHERKPEVLDDHAEDILVLVATNGVGFEPSAGQVAAHVDEEVLVAQYHLDRLVDRGFLEEDILREPPTYSITRKGRAYVVENELI